MTEPKTIDNLLAEGWKPLDSYGNCFIYGKGDERKLYDPVTDNVIIEYVVPKINKLENKK